MDNVQNQPMKMVVAPINNVKQDLLKNGKFISFTFLALFSYILVSSIVISTIENDWSFWKSIYFTIINTTTVGFGDITPLENGGKVIACFNSIVGLIFFGAIVSLITLAFQPDSYSGTIVNLPSEKTNEESKEYKIAEGLTCLSELLLNSEKERPSELNTKTHHYEIHTFKDIDHCHIRIDIFSTDKTQT